MNMGKNIVELDTNTPCVHIHDLLIFRIGYDLSTENWENNLIELCENTDGVLLSSSTIIY